ncbi:hypothetical protein VNI00_015697 [Paramarasmius palmivorus]|uniref:Uncharacterized protein n=1 Tax=Paramarasmius palmivorus TaxID=297713 RepID=A0AAW0BIM9_9AGAR
MQVLSETLSHSSRLETIKLEISSDALQSLAERCIQPASALRSLHIVGNGCKVPIEFLGGGAPLLTKLVLDNCGLAYDSPLLYNLTSFHLMGTYGATSFEARLYEALGFMPALECLSLNEVYSSTQANTNTSVVNLPMLRRLDIKNSYLESSRLFDYISFPGTAVVQIIIRDTGLPARTDIDELDTFWADITQILSPEFCPGYQRAVRSFTAGADASGGTSFTLRAWHTSLPLDFFTSNNEHAALHLPDFSVKVDWSEKDLRRYENRYFFEDVFETAFDALSALHLPALETMRIGRFPRPAHRTNLLQQALRSHMQSESLRRLILYGSRCAEYLPDVLRQHGNAESMPLPALEELVLIYPYFSDILVDNLYDKLEARAGQGRKLEKLVIHERGSCDEVYDLQRVVNEVNIVLK